MLRLRPYTPSDASTILSWTKNKTAFYQWTAGVLGEYPITEEQFNMVYAKDIFGAKKVSLGVFENNELAYYCYKAAGFQDVLLDEVEKYTVLGEEWRCLELEIQL